MSTDAASSSGVLSRFEQLRFARGDPRGGSSVIDVVRATRRSVLRGGPARVGVSRQRDRDGHGQGRVSRPEDRGNVGLYGIPKKIVPSLITGDDFVRTPVVILQRSCGESESSNSNFPERSAFPLKTGHSVSPVCAGLLSRRELKILYIKNTSFRA